MEVLTQDIVQALKAAVPKQDEYATVARHVKKKGVVNLGKAELFVNEMEAVPRLQGRLNTWQVITKFADEMEEIGEAIDCVTKASSLPYSAGCSL